MTDPTRVDDLFFAPVARDEFASRFGDAIGKATALSLIADNFSNNCYSVSQMCSLSTHVGFWILFEKRVQTLAIANIIEAGGFSRGRPDEEPLRKDAYERAAQEVAGSSDLPPMDLALAAAGPFVTAFREAIEELLRQGLVLTWGAIEVLASDLFVLLLNQKPSLAGRLARDETARRLFDLKAIPFDVLEEKSFDLRLCMGDVLLESHRLDSSQSIKTAFNALLPADNELHQQLARPDFYQLGQRRHLIVHRRGIIDEEYRRRMPAAPPLGSRVVASAADVRAALVLARDVGVALLRSASTLLGASRETGVEER